MFSPATLCTSVLLLVTIARPPLLAGQQAADSEFRTAIDSFVERRIAEDAFSGAVLVAKDGQIIYQRATGMANRDAGQQVTIDTRLQIASATKLYTQIAIRQLEQAGKLSLGDTVGKFMPEYPNAVVRSKVTVDQLLRHRSGIGSFWNAEYVARRAEIRSVNDYVEIFQSDSLLFTPGTSDAYSNGGYVLLGAIIEKVSGQSYHEYLRENVFRPAGMTATAPFDSRVTLENAAVGYTRQTSAGPVAGDSRLAGGSQAIRRGPSAAGGGERRPNTGSQAGMSSPAGNHFSTVGDFLKLANALTSHRLLDSARSHAVLGARSARGTDFRANGGGPGANAEFSIFPTGDVLVVLSNYDPPSATTVAEYVRSLVAPAVPVGPGAAESQTALRSEVDSLHAAMIAAFKRDPASVAQFYMDDASILGGGGRHVGRAQVDAYWRQATMFTEWKLEVIEVGGGPEAPWVRGRSTITGQSGRSMVTEYVGILKRQADGRLKFYVDMFVGSPSTLPR